MIFMTKDQSKKVQKIIGEDRSRNIISRNLRCRNEKDTRLIKIEKNMVGVEDWDNMALLMAEH